MKSSITTLRNKSGTPAGWERILFSVIKKDPARPDVKRVEGMLSLLVAAERHSYEHERVGSRLDKVKGASEASSWAYDYQASKRAYVRTLEKIEKALRRYRWRASVSEESDKGHFQYELYCIANPKSRWGDWEGAIVAKLLELTKRPGELSRFRRCSECHEWFYAITGHQHFCGESCRRRHAAQDPEFKAKRRIYMREKYRPQLKELERRSIANARMPLPKKAKG